MPTKRRTAHLGRELGGTLKCAYCDRLFHSLCLRDPAVTDEHLPGRKWACPCCGEEQQVRGLRGRGACVSACVRARVWGVHVRMANANTCRCCCCCYR